MKLYFLRHADAAPGLDDAARPLTNKGLDQCRRLGRFCRQAGIEFDAAYASPLLRARQTAEAVLSECEPELADRVILDDALLSAPLPDRFDRWLDGIPSDRHVLLVGHAPSLAAYARRMLGLGRPDALELSKAAMVCLKTEDRRAGGLRFMLRAKWLPD